MKKKNFFKLKYCKICLQTDTRPQSKFTEQGICPACSYYLKTKEIDWDQRLQILKKIVAKNKTSKFYDGVLGVSGGKDSTRQALWLREKLNLNPLLVCLAYPPEQVTDRGCENISNLIELGFDVIIESLAPKTWKSLMKSCFNDDANWIKASEQALKSSAIKVAIRKKIKIVFWGENSALQLGDLKTKGRSGWDGNNNRYTNTLKGAEMKWILKYGYDYKDVFSYEYPKEEDFKKNDIQIIYMGWFLKDWSLGNNGSYAILNNLVIRTDKPENTGDLYGTTALDEDWVTLNQMIKYFKYGFGRASDYVNEEIRIGNLSRELSVEFVNKYDGKCSDRYIGSFCKYLGISRKYFWKKVKSVTNKNLFKINNNKIIKNFKVGVGHYEK